MKLSSTIELMGGGPGSGCNPRVGKCGRKKKSSREVYHGTLTKFVSSIKQKGLVATNLGILNIEGSTVEVYTTTDKEDAIAYGVSRVEREYLNYRSGKLNAKYEPAIAVVVIDAKKANVVELSKDYAGGRIRISKGNIPPSAIKRIELYRYSKVPKTSYKMKPSKTIKMNAAASNEIYMAVVIGES